MTPVRSTTEVVTLGVMVTLIFLIGSYREFPGTTER
jgi:hypothetical protein